VGLSRPNLSFSPLRTTLPLLDSARAKMLKLEEVASGQLEAEGHALAEVVVEHVLTCFQSWDP
jgi:hypothetical protein